MSVSRDFIDSCSPEDPDAGAAPDPARASSPGPTAPAAAQCDGTTLAFGFRAAPGQDVDILAQDSLFLCYCRAGCRGGGGGRMAARGDPSRHHRGRAAVRREILNLVFTRVVNH